MRNRKFQKNNKKIQKIKIYHYGLISSQKYVGKVQEREKIKIIVPVRSYPTHYRKFEKNRKKNQKIIKYHYSFISSQNWLEKAEIERK